MPRRLRRFGRHHADIAWWLLSSVLAVAVAVVIAHFGA